MSTTEIIRHMIRGAGNVLAPDPVPSAFEKSVTNEAWSNLGGYFKHGIRTATQETARVPASSHKPNGKSGR